MSQNQKERNRPVPLFFRVLRSEIDSGAEANDAVFSDLAAVSLPAADSVKPGCAKLRPMYTAYV